MTAVSDRSFESLADEDTVSITAGSLRSFLDQVRSGAPEPLLTYAHRGVERQVSFPEATVSRDDGEVFCDIRWMREDVIAACDHVYGIRLDRDAEGVEDMIDDVVGRIGDCLQDRSTEFGYELIYEFLPGYAEVARLARLPVNEVPVVAYDSPLTGERHRLALYAERYLHGGGLALGLFDADARSEDFGEQWSTLTVNLPDDPTAMRWCERRNNVVMDANNNPRELIETLVGSGLLRLTDRTVRSGFCDYPLATVPEGVLQRLRDYEESVALMQVARAPERALAQPSPGDVSDAARNVARDARANAAARPAAHH